MSRKENDIIKVKSVSPHLLNYLNHLNQDQKGGVVLPKWHDEQTGEIGPLTHFPFKVGECLYFQHTGGQPGKKGTAYWRSAQWYRWKPLLFRVQVMTVHENRGIKKGVAIKGENPKDVQNLFDVPRLEYDCFSSDKHSISWHQEDANLLDFYKFFAQTEPSPEQTSRAKFERIFQNFLNIAFDPIQPIDFDADGEKWYKKITL